MNNLLSQLANSVTDAEDLEGLTRPLLELLEAVTGLESTYLTTIDAEAGLQHILFARNIKTMQIPEGLSVPWDDTLCKRALLENRPYTNDVGSCWGDSDAARQLGIQTYISQPVRNLDGELFGTLCAASAERVTLAEEVLNVLMLFSRLIAYQIARERTVNQLRRTNEELSQRVKTDALTGVANRRAMEDELQRALERARRDHSNVQVAFIDLDGFKAINDRYGHEAGDQLLSQIASRLVSGLRRSDFIARYGGDEFVVITQNVDADEFRHRLEQLTMVHFSRGELSICYPGASVGIAEAGGGDDNVRCLISRADSAMYASKQSRRHRRLCH